MTDPDQQQVADWCGSKLFRIRELIEREPTTSLANRILGVLNEPPPWVRSPT
jgi:hypothetical protein